METNRTFKKTQKPKTPWLVRNKTETLSLRHVHKILKLFYAPLYFECNHWCNEQQK